MISTHVQPICGKANFKEKHTPRVSLCVSVGGRGVGLDVKLFIVSSKCLWTVVRLPALEVSRLLREKVETHKINMTMAMIASFPREK